MRNSSQALLVLLLTATAVASALALQWASESPRGWTEDDWAIGLALAQVQLAAAATVFCQRRLWLRLSGLVFCISFWTIALSAAMSWDAHRQILFAWQLVATALVTSAWCGGQTFLGWRIGDADVTEDETAVTPRQFSLATLMFAMAIVGGYLGVARIAGFSARDSVEILFVLAVTLAGCSAFTSTAGGWRAAPFGVIVVVGCIAPPVWLWIDGGGATTASLWRVAIAFLAQLSSAMFVLHLAGMRLVRTEQRNPSRTLAGARCGDQSAAC
jgi:hypothetical protein